MCVGEREKISVANFFYKNHSFSPFFLLLHSGNHFVLFFLYRPLSYYSVFFRSTPTPSFFRVLVCFLSLSVCLSVCLCEMLFFLSKYTPPGKKFHKEVLTRVGQAVNLDWFYFFGSTQRTPTTTKSVAALLAEESASHLSLHTGTSILSRRLSVV